MTLVRVIARPLTASSFAFSGVDRLRSAGTSAAQLQPVLTKLGKTVPSLAPVTGDAKRVAQVLGAAQLGAGILLGLGRFSRIAGTLLAVSAAANTLVDFKSADSSTPAARKERRSQLLRNLSLVGAALLASVDTNGRPGLAWRAEHFAYGAKKNAVGLSRDAAKQLKKADRAVRRTASDVVGS